jgi:hypothetical protein
MGHRTATTFSLLIVLTLSLAASTGCSRDAGSFSEPNARAHIEMLAGTIGSRAIGTPANARARVYIVDQLRQFGFEVRVQDTDARRRQAGRSARVANIIAVRPGRRPEAVGIVSHYDSVPYGPGAADDAFGVGVSLEAARVLAARADRNWTLMVLVTDGEEAGLMGAAALMTDRDVTSRLQAYINLEAIGSAGQPRLFEAGPGNGWLITPWARLAPYPRGASFGTEIYRRLPNDTDFSILKLQGIPGLNFAVVDDSYAYHTPRDTPDRLSRSTVQDGGAQLVTLVTALDRVDITQRSSAEHTFFDVGGATALSYGPEISTLIAGAALLFGIIGWVKVTAAAIRLEGALRWLLTFVWALVGAAAVIVSMAGATWALRLARESFHPWYARPGRLLLLLLAVGLTVTWASVRIGHWLPQWARGVRHPFVVWSLALPVWIALAGASTWLAPGASYLWLLPLLSAGLLLTIIPASSNIAVRIVSVLVLALVAALWLRTTIDLLYFVVAVFGRLPVITPSFVYAIVMAAAGLMIVPPFVATVAAIRPLLRPSLGTALCLFAVAATAGFAYAAPAYTYQEPLRRHLRVFQDGDGPAVWQVGSVEPGLDLAEHAPTGWQAGPPADTGKPGSLPVTRLPYPFVFHRTGPSMGPAPMTIAAITMEPVAAGTEVSITAVPRDAGLVLSFVLPGGVEPARSSLPGIVRRGLWTATYFGPSADGIVFRASFASKDAARLRDLRILVTVEGMSDGGWQAPDWLPQERSVWETHATWSIDPFALPIAPVPALR